MQTAPPPQEDWQPPLEEPRCPTCYHRMPTPAHVFLHAQQHGDQVGALPLATLRHLPLNLFDRIAQLMQDDADSRTA